MALDDLKGTIDNPYSYYEYEAIASIAGNWQGGWVLDTHETELLYINVYNNTTQTISKGQRNFPFSYEEYYDMTICGNWHGGWVKDSSNEKYYINEEGERDTDPQESGCGTSGSSNGSGCGSGSGEGEVVGENFQGGRTEIGSNSDCHIYLVWTSSGEISIEVEFSNSYQYTVTSNLINTVRVGLNSVMYSGQIQYKKTTTRTEEVTNEDGSIEYIQIEEESGGECSVSPGTINIT